jgi:serine/threonine-protein kinase
MSVLFLARDRILGRRVAIKILRDDLYPHPALERRFLREARVNAQLQHPGIAPLYDVGRMPDGRPFLVVRFVHGRTLDDLLAARTAPADDLPRFLDVVSQVARAVAYAHAKGVVHRDLKPANVVVSPLGGAWLLDWGLAKVLGDPAEPAGAAEPPAGPADDPAPGSRVVGGGDPGQTGLGTAIGTPAYIAPEQARCRTAGTVDERADVFGLGGTLCTVLTGEPPFTGDPADVWAKARRGDLSEAHARLAGCGGPPGAIGLAVRCLAARPEDRPRNAGEVARAIATLLVVG